MRRTYLAPPNSRLPKLTTLDLRHNRIESDGITALAAPSSRLKNLVEVRLEGNKVSEEVTRQTKQKMEELK